MIEFIVHIGLLSAATWRLASLFSSEDGPLDMFFFIRQLAGVQYHYVDGRLVEFAPEWEDIKRKDAFAFVQWSFMKGLCCVWCESVWWGILLSLLYWARPTLALGVAFPLTISAAAIWLDRRMR